MYILVRVRQELDLAWRQLMFLPFMIFYPHLVLGIKTEWQVEVCFVKV